MIKQAAQKLKALNKTPERQHEIAEKLDVLNKTLEKQSGIMQQMLDAMPKESGKFTRVLELIVLFVGIFGFISIVDVILGWVIGG